MVIRFNWFMYSVFIGCLRKGGPVKGILHPNESEGTLNVDTVKNRDRIKAPGHRPATVRRKSIWERSKVVGWQGMLESVEEGMGELCLDDQVLRKLAQAAITELRPLILAAGIKKQGKQDLLLSLLRLLKSYTALTVLQAYPFRVAINNIIEKETASRCSIHLNNEELLALWREVR